MAVFRIQKTHDYTVMSNYHLRDRSLSLRAKGLLSVILSLPEEWNYTTRGLASICREGVDSIGTTIKELERAGYITRKQLRNAKGMITDMEYTIYEEPTIDSDTTEPKADALDTAAPCTEIPDMEQPAQETPHPGMPMQLNTNQFNTYISKPQESNPYPSILPGTDSNRMDAKEREREIRRTRIEVQDQIDYEATSCNLDRERVDEIVELMVETLCSKRETIRRREACGAGQRPIKKD